VFLHALNHLPQHLLTGEIAARGNAQTLSPPVALLGVSWSMAMDTYIHVQPTAVSYARV
jgi:hypothetical protein